MAADGDRERHAAIEPGRAGPDEVAIDREQLPNIGPMNLRAGKPGEPLRGFAMDVHGDSRRGFRGAMQTVGRRRADVNPCLKRAGRIANRDWRIVWIGQTPAREFDSWRVFAAVGEYPGDEVLLGFGWVTCDFERQRFVHAAVAVGEIDLDGMNGR